MSLSSILCSWIQLTERNKTWKFEENQLRKLNDTQSSKTMISSSLFSSSRLIFSSKTMILSSEYHYSFEIENLYHLLCAFSFYFSIFFENTHELNSLLLRKSLSFTMCFFILFLDFLWKHAWAQLSLTEKISIIYYVLSHSIFRRAHWENLYHLLCASSFYFSIFFENMHELNSLLLRKSLSFTMCFLILFLDERTEKISIICYVLLHSISRFSLKTRMNSTRSYWENLYHLLCAFPFYFSMNALRKSLSFTMCFLIEFILFLDEHIVIEKTSIIYYVLLHSILQRARFSLKTWLWTQLALTEKISIIYYVLSHRVHSISRQAHCHWENLYYLLCASSFYSSTSSIFFENMHELNSLLLRKPQSFTMCFLILFLDFLWKHAWAQLSLTEKTSIIYYVLFHSIFRRTHWENLYHLLCAFSFYFSIFFENTHELNSLLLRKLLSFTMCFLILFLDFLWKHTWIQLALTEKISIIYYVLSHSIFQRAHWRNLYHLLCAFSFYFSIFFENTHELNSFLLKKSLSFTMCFLIVFILFLDERIVIEKISII